MVWPTPGTVQARLGVPALDPADAADLADALAAAIDTVVDHSTVYREWVTAGGDPDDPPERVTRGTTDLAVAYYERRGTGQDAFTYTGLPQSMLLSFHRLLGTGRYAYPQITGGT